MGITPACAGKTRFRMQAASSNRDHPRVCGENLPVCYVLRGCVGSPPRVRGKQRRAGRRDAQRRITPACAGKTLSAFLRLLPLEDHPRVCGENSLIAPVFPAMSGSPPRVRGKLQRVHRLAIGHRITPACAGKTARSAWHFTAARDHPRVCGENLYQEALPVNQKGSPPRVRGKRQHFLCYLFRFRITPACAGKTHIAISALLDSWDHPRVCGENAVVREDVIKITGSPPRVRGKRPPVAGRGRAGGITPACAGKTSGESARQPHGQDHPRVCGENKNISHFPRSS